jgi:hypothetical protein
MKVYGNQFETPTVVPNRTVSAMRDIAYLVREIGPTEGKTEEEILKTSAEKFRAVGFSEVLRPLSPHMDLEDEEIVQIYLSILVQTFLRTEFDIRFLTIIVLVIKCWTTTRKTRPTLPLTISDIDQLTGYAKSIEDRKSLKLSLLGVVVGIVRPSVRTVPLYIDLGGFPGLRDNLKDATTKSLSRGAETQRTVRIDTCDDGDVALYHDNEIVFKLGALTRHNSEFRKACTTIFQELEDIIPPPVYSEPEKELLDVLPSRQVKSLLKSGRIAPRKRPSSLPSIS